jgi:hypothetical protein
VRGRAGGRAGRDHCRAHIGRRRDRGDLRAGERGRAARLPEAGEVGGGHRRLGDRAHRGRGDERDRYADGRPRRRGGRRAELRHPDRRRQAGQVVDDAAAGLLGLGLRRVVRQCRRDRGERGARPAWSAGRDRHSPRGTSRHHLRRRHRLRRRRHQSWALLDRAGRLDLFRSLDERGVFAVRRAIEQVAGRLGISRASAYSYLSQSRKQANTGGHS